MENCLIFRECQKEELLGAITETIGTHVLQLMTSSEAADLLGIDVKTIADWKNIGMLTDYSKHNEHRKFSAAEVLSLRRMDAGERRLLYAQKKQKVH